MADTISQEQSFAPPKKKGIAGAPCAIKSQDQSHYRHPCNSLVMTSVWLDHGNISNDYCSSKRVILMCVICDCTLYLVSQGTVVPCI